MTALLARPQRHDAAVRRGEREEHRVARPQVGAGARRRLHDGAARLRLAVQRAAEEHDARKRPLEDIDVVGLRRTLLQQLDILRTRRRRDRRALRQRLARHAAQHALRRLDDGRPARLRRRADRPLEEVGGADELRREPVARRLVDLARRPVLNQPAAVHHRHLIRERQRLQLVVRHEQRRDAEAGGELLQLVPHLLPQFRVQVAERLVEQQRFRLVDERAGEREALLLPAAQLRRGALLQAVQVHERERAQDAVAHFRAGELTRALLQRKRHVVEHVHMRPNGVGLKHHPHRAAMRRNPSAVAPRHQRRALQRDLAVVRALQPSDAPQRRGLAASRRPQQREERPRLDLERDVLYRMDFALIGLEPLGEVAYLKRRRHKTSRPATAGLAAAPRSA